MIVGLGLRQLLGSKFALSMSVVHLPFIAVLRSGCVGLGMCFVMVWLYDQCLFVLEC